MGEDTKLALAALRECRQNLRAARIDATTAATRLSGARRAWAIELAELLSVVLAHLREIGGGRRGGFKG
jgi:hypothetical protein